MTEPSDSSGAKRERRYTLPKAVAIASGTNRPELIEPLRIMVLDGPPLPAEQVAGLLAFVADLIEQRADRRVRLQSLLTKVEALVDNADGFVIPHLGDARGRRRDAG